MPLFHATTLILELNQPKTAHVRNLTEIQARIEREFDQLRPAARISRSEARFAGDDPAFCAAYLVSEPLPAETPIYIYCVQMVGSPSQHPMCLVSYARHFVEDREVLIKIISEYWAPTQSWKCWEYPSSSITPVAIEPTPDTNAIAGAKFRYGKDLDLAQRLWPIQKSCTVRQL